MRAGPRAIPSSTPAASGIPTSTCSSAQTAPQTAMEMQIEGAAAAWIMHRTERACDRAARARDGSDERTSGAQGIPALPAVKA